MTAIRTRSRAAILVTALLAVLGAAGLFAGRAAAQTPTCSTNGCDFQDPIATHCVDDSYPVGSVPIYALDDGHVGDVDLIWSPKCQTNWARVTSLIGPISQIPPMKVEIGRASPYGWESLDSDGALLQGRSPLGSAGGPISLDPNSTSLYTDMLYAPGPAEAIGRVDGVAATFAQASRDQFPAYPF
jgi:hypothetical protein